MRFRADESIEYEAKNWICFGPSGAWVLLEKMNSQLNSHLFSSMLDGPRTNVPFRTLNG